MEPEPQAFWSLYTQELLEKLASAASGLTMKRPRGASKFLLMVGAILVI